MQDPRLPFIEAPAAAYLVHNEVLLGGDHNSIVYYIWYVKTRCKLQKVHNSDFVHNECSRLPNFAGQILEAALQEILRWVVVFSRAKYPHNNLLNVCVCLSCSIVFSLCDWQLQSEGFLNVCLYILPRMHGLTLPLPISMMVVAYAYHGTASLAQTHGTPTTEFLRCIRLY